MLKQGIVAELDKKTLLNKKGDPWQKCLYISNHLLKRYKHQLTHVQMRMPDRYSLLICQKVPLYTNGCIYIQDDSLARGPKLLSLYTAQQDGFLVRKYWQTG